MSSTKTRHSAYRYRQREAARRKTRRRTSLIAFTGVVLVVVLALIVAALAGGSRSATVPTGGQAAHVIQAVTSVPIDVSSAVGRGSATVQPTKVSAPPITGGEKPEVLYIGAEFCPYCATERWPIVVALSRFGTFANLGFTESSDTDVFANTPTFTFHGSTFTSQFFTFTAVETQTRTGAPLDTPSAAAEAHWTQLDPKRTIPFIDLGGSYVVTGATYDPSVLQHHSWTEIAEALRDPANPLARGILGAANDITAAICKTTGDQPATVCANPAITAIEGQVS